MLGRVARVQAHQVPLALDGLGGLVVQPHGGAQPARLLRGQGERVARGVAEAGGDLAVARVEPVLGEEVGLGDLALAPGESVEDLAVRHCAARDGLDVAEIGAGETQADRGVGAESVARFQDHETAPGAHEGGSGAQQLLQRVRQCGGARQALGQFVQSGEIRDPTCESVLENGPGSVWRSGRRGTRGGRRGRDSVCGRWNR